MELKRVVVTGLGAITPIGNSVPEFWENLVNGVSGAGPITHFDASLFKTQFACEVKGFDATKYIDRKEARKMDLYTQYAIAVAKEAVGDSGLDVENEDLNRIGVIFGAGIDENMDDEVRITVIATGFEKTPFPKKEDAKKKTGSDRDWTRSFSGGGTAYDAGNLRGTPLVQQDYPTPSYEDMSFNMPMDEDRGSSFGGSYMGGGSTIPTPAAMPPPPMGTKTAWISPGCWRRISMPMVPCPAITSGSLKGWAKV